MYPIIIPLAEDPKNEYKELRYTLRGIDRYYKGLKDVIILGPKKPEWIQGVCFIRMNDLQELGKDHNMINKIKVGIRHLTGKGYQGIFTKFSDDFILLREYEPAKEKPKYFDELISSYNRIKKPIVYGDFVMSYSKFAEKLLNTMNALADIGVFSPLNFETHTPQPYHTNDFEDLFKNVPDEININSYYLNLSEKFSENQQITVDPKNPNRLAQLSNAANVKEVQQSVKNCKFLNINGNDAFVSFDGSKYSPIERYFMKTYKKSRFEQ